MKKIIFILILPFFLFSCANEEVKEEKKVVKQDFFIETKKIWEFSKDFSVEKSWKLKSAQNITVTSQAIWKVSQLYVKEWEKVQKWQVLAILEDNIANYHTSLEKIKNSLATARLNYKSTANTYDKNIKSLKLSIENNKINEKNSKSSIDLEKIENSINKLKIDYEKLKTTNIETGQSYVSNMKVQLDNIKILTDNIIDFSDNILSVTEENKNTNKAFKDYLWAKDLGQKEESEKKLESLIEYRQNILENIEFNSENSLYNNIEKIDESYSLVYAFLMSIEKTLDNSLSSVNNFTESQISGYKTNIDWYFTGYTANNQAFISIRNSINSFLETYKNNQESLEKQISLLENDKNIFIKWLDVQQETNNLSLRELEDNKTLALMQINNTIKDLELSYNEALNNYKKLSIDSPIDGIIWKVYIEKDQELTKWSLVVEISNDIENEIVISFSKDELKFIHVWKQVFIKHWEKEFSWEINTISSQADENLKYHSKIYFSEKLDFKWDIVKVLIPIKLKDNYIVPLNILKVQNNNTAILNLYLNNNIVEKKVNIWKIYWDKIEILDKLSINTNIITTDISNFDKNKFNLKLKH